MELEIYNAVRQSAFNGYFELIGILPCISISWEVCYDTTGSAQIVAIRDDETANLLRVGTFMRIPAERGLMYIHSVKMTDTEIWAYAYEAKELLRKVGMWNTYHDYGDDVAEALLTVVRLWCDFSWLRWGDLVEGEPQPLEVDGDIGTADMYAMVSNNTYEYIQKACKLKGFGFYIDIDSNSNRGVIYLYEGSNKTQTVRIASAWGSISSVNYTESDKSYFNHVVAVGADADGYDLIGEASRTDEGVNEVYTHVLDLREEYPKPDDMTVADYRSVLSTRAAISLGQRKMKQSVDVKDLQADDVGDEATLGDLVLVVMPEIGHGLTVVKRITSILYTVEGGVLAKKMTIDKP